MQHKEDTPQDNVGAQILAERILLHEEVCRKGPCQESKVEQAREPAILGANKIKIVPNAVQGGVRERRFIDVEENLFLLMKTSR